ncbi:DNA-protecting protein DprA [Musicola keenii]|uniref:DNA-protecting protein DprA n=1 Tax=Musicola keenii TaxID=2884250 RepID=UPI0017868A2C|nr:DNA-protecting protein DprA [Musicola keenii]
MTDTEIWLRVASIKGLSVQKVVRLVKRIIRERDSAVDFLRASGLDERQTARFIAFDRRQLDDVERWLEDSHCHFVTYGSGSYPPLLASINSPPPFIFVRGDNCTLSSAQMAVVGSRDNSNYGEQWGRFFSRELAANRLIITSGLAVGIDGIAHQAALDAGGKTIAVLGSGLRQIYPKRHAALADAIVENGGAIVSEFLLKTPPIAANFPRRNRIISGLSLGVLVIEASMRSGSLVTARYALEQNRDVFALPGPVGNPMTEGTHWLIQQGAYLVTHPKDILEQLHNGLQWLSDISSGNDEEIICSPEAELELPFADVLANVGDEVTPVDVVAERAGQPVPEVVSKLLDLELAGWIAAVPGGYVRIRRACHVRRTHVLV